MSLKSIAKTDLTVGMYIELNLSWFDHPFASSRFLIRDAATLNAVQRLKTLGDSLQWDPEKSQLERASLPVPEARPQPALTPAQVEQRQTEQEVLRAARSSVNAAERKVLEFGHRLRQLMPNLTSGAALAFDAAADIAQEVSRDLASDPDAVMQLINVNTGDHGYFERHAINVTALSVMLARAAQLPEDQIVEVGLGAFLHDIGVARLPGHVVHKKGPLSLPEERLYQEHVAHGTRIAGEGLPGNALDVIAYHHAHWDGTGQPAGLSGEQIPTSAQVVAIANRYDNLCNPRSGIQGMAPTDAIKQIFRKERQRFNPRLIDLFIRCLGIYPPGTMVGLSDDRTAVVVASNPEAPLKPTVVVYDPMIERNQASPLCLDASGQPSITHSYAMCDLPDAVGAYLALSSRMHYYLAASVDQEVINAGQVLKQQLRAETHALERREVVE